METENVHSKGNPQAKGLEGQRFKVTKITSNSGPALYQL